MNKYHIFISHAWMYSEHYCMVEDWLDENQSKYLLSWDNYSVPLHAPDLDINTFAGKEKLREKLDGQIKRASIILILSGMYFNHPDWIEYEILTAVNNEKYIIGVKPWGQERIPQVITNNANVIIEWSKPNIIKALGESIKHNRNAYA